MFINQQSLFTEIEKYIGFRGLVTLDNRINEYLYRGLDLVRIHYNKAGFSVKCIECDGEFK